MKSLALLVGKTLSVAGKMTGRGTSLPGVYARKFDKDIFAKIKMPEHIIVVTGTNGKTSTANMIAKMFRDNGYKVVNNTKGANLLGGLLTTILENTSFDFTLKADVLVLEVDEATYPTFTKYITPTHLVVTNFFRDQLDRYGEMEVLVEMVNRGISENTKLILNADDPLTSLLGFKNKKNVQYYYGLNRTKYSVEQTNQVREAKFCPNCGKRLAYRYYHYSQLGFYECDCEFAHPETKYLATDVDLATKTFKVGSDKYKLNYDNLYFIYNALTAIALADLFKLPYISVQNSLYSFRVDDGRMESFTIGEYETYLNLVKNPTGLNQTLEHVIRLQEDQPYTLFMTLNNLAADGTDTSWIWDVDFEQLAQTNIETFYCSGIRAYDLATRLKYAGIPVDKIVVNPNIEEHLKTLKDTTTSKPYILSTYTALQETRKILLADQGGK